MYNVVSIISLCSKKLNFKIANRIYRYSYETLFRMLIFFFYGLLIKGVENVIVMNMEQYEGILNMYSIYWRC